MKVIILSASICGLLSCSTESDSMSSTTNKSCDLMTSDSSNTATYNIVFNASWSKITHPVDFPSNPHFSRIVAATHNTSYSMWKNGEKSSDGIIQVAETGATSTIDRELYTAQMMSNVCVYSIASSGISQSPGDYEFNIRVHKDFNHISLISMIAPSPDWFVGISSLSLYESGDWLNTVTLQATPWDAGSDSGASYSSANSTLETPLNISQIIESPFKASANETVSSLGSFTITKI